jgi:serpin peptidase inhibitor clade A protein 3
MGTSLWANEATGFKFDSEYLAKARKYFGSMVEEFDFSAEVVELENPRAAKGAKGSADLAKGSPKDVINSAVANDTDGMIKDLISQLDPGLDSILISTLLIDAEWERQFEIPKTKRADDEKDPGVFYVNGKEKNIDMMNQISWLEHAPGKYFDAVRLNTSDGAVSVEFYLPKEDAIESVKDDFINGDELVNSASFQSKMVDFSLPRFKANYKKNITADLRQIAPSLFVGADISKIGNKKLVLAKGIHQTALELHEYGFRAAAATALMMRETVAIDPQADVTVNVNRAFGIRIVSNAGAGLELFKGWIVDPEKMEAPTPR